MKSGKISLDTAKKYIELEAHTEEAKLFSKQAKLLDNIDIYSLIDKYSITPEDVVLEEEKISEISSVLKEIQEILTPMEFDILWLKSVEGYSQAKIADRYNTYQRDISRKLEEITAKCLDNFKDRLVIIREIFVSPQSKLTAHAPTVRGYPHELLQQVSVEGHWRKNRKGINTYISKNECRIPEYLQSSYNGENCWCTLCADDLNDFSKCSRLEVD